MSIALTALSELLIIILKYLDMHAWRSNIWFLLWKLKNIAQNMDQRSTVYAKPYITFIWIRLNVWHIFQRLIFTRFCTSTVRMWIGWRTYTHTHRVDSLVEYKRFHNCLHFYVYAFFLRCGARFRRRARCSAWFYYICSSLLIFFCCCFGPNDTDL